jgi:hypothetical protein
MGRIRVLKRLQFRDQVWRVVRQMVLAGVLVVGFLHPSPGISATPETPTETGTQPTEPSDILGPHTIMLFEAIRTGSLSAVQQAVLDGASLTARGPEGKTAAELAESLEKYTITHFLRVYETIEQTDTSRVTEKAPESPIPAPAVSESLPELTFEPSTTPEPGHTLPAVSTPVMEPAPEVVQQVAVPQPTVTEMPTRSETVPETGGDVPAGSESYFSRLSVLNPTPGAGPEVVIVEAQPDPGCCAGEIAEGVRRSHDYSERCTGVCC